jgi:uncharacterized protein (TIRG00374 family)
MLKKVSSSSYFRSGVALIISALCVYLAIRDVNLRDVGASIVGADIRYVAWGLISVGVNLSAKIQRWRVLLGGARLKVSPSKLSLSFIFAQLLNAFLPARIGEISRVVVIGREGVGFAFVLGTIAIEKFLDMIAYAVLFLSILFFLPLPDWLGNSGYVFILLTILVSLSVFLILTQRSRIMRFLSWLTSRVGLSDRWQTVIAKNLGEGFSSLEVFQSRKNVFMLAFWSAIIWGTAILTNYLILLALQINLPLEAALLILIVLQAGISIPSLPGKIGTFEYACILSLKVFGIGTPSSLSYGILLHAVVYVPIVVLGLASFWLLQLESSDIRLIEKTAQDRNL